jgi:hypothetical protein
MSTILEIQKQLQAALSDSAKIQTDYEAALAKLEPLRQASEAKNAEVNSLIHEFQKATGAAPAVKTRKKGTYSIDPTKKVEALYKRTVSRLTNQGVPEGEAKKKAKAAADGLKVKLGIK